MKALSGGLITDARLTFTHMRQYENAVPIYGIQKMSASWNSSWNWKNVLLSSMQRWKLPSPRTVLSLPATSAVPALLHALPDGHQHSESARMEFLLCRSPYQRFSKATQEQMEDHFLHQLRPLQEQVSLRSWIHPPCYAATLLTIVSSLLTMPTKSPQNNSCTEGLAFDRSALHFSEGGLDEIPAYRRLASWPHIK